VDDHGAPGGLAALLGGRDVEGFLQEHWERRPVLAAGAAADLLGTLLTLNEFESLSQANPGDLSVVQEGKARPLVAARADASTPPSAQLQAFGAYGSGATLLLSSLHVQWPPVTRLCRDIELDLLDRGVLLAEPVSANAYLTPPDAQGFGIHYDDHCVLIVQLHGHKRWQVFQGEKELPLDRSDGPIPRARLGSPIQSTVLASGDVLYIPRGFPHSASTGAASSLHLTVGLHTLTWAQAVAEILHAEAAFRRSVPPRGDADPGPPALPALDVAGYLERRRVQCLAALDPLPDGRFSAIDAAREIEPDTLVHRVPRMVSESSTDGELACLTFPGATLRLHRLMRPVLDYVSGAEAFRPEDLPTIAASYDAVQLTRILVQRGLFRPVDRPKEPVSRRDRTDPADRGPVAAEPLHEIPKTRTFDLALRQGGGPAVAHHLGWLRLEQRLIDEVCDEIITTCRAFPLTAPTTVDETNHPDHRQAEARHLQVNSSTSWIFDLIENVAAEAARTTYRFDLTGISRAPQYVEYHPGNGHFHRHNDYSHDQLDSPRKLTVIIQLSEPTDYEGGRLQMFGVETEELPRERGTVLVFPSLIDHCVTPVVSGVRRALVAWVAGPRLR
jgi:predicted 2-oxoglutarate/Fe(II)-dependent dioxygenase YbiX